MSLSSAMMDALPVLAMATICRSTLTFCHATSRSSGWRLFPAVFAADCMAAHSSAARWSDGATSTYLLQSNEANRALPAWRAG